MEEINKENTIEQVQPDPTNVNTYGEIKSLLERIGIITKLRALESNNYSLDAKGWRIEADGTTFFNNIRLGKLTGDHILVTDGVLTVDLSSYISSIAIESLKKEFTFGEDVEDGDIVCIKQIKTNSRASTSAWTNGEPAYRDTNYSTEEYINLYDQYSIGAGAYIKWDTTDFPDAEKILKAELILTPYGSGAGYTCNVSSIASWSESTVTFNTRPSSVYAPIPSISLVLGTPADITQLVRRWAKGLLTNNGIFINSAYNVQCYSSRALDADNIPTIRITTLENAEPNLYLASPTDYNLCRKIVGIVQGDHSASETGNVIIKGVYSGVNISDIGATAYLSSATPGKVTSTYPFTGRVCRVGDTWSYQELSLDIDKRDIYIEEMVNILIPAGTTSVLFPCPEDARIIIATFSRLGATSEARSEKPSTGYGTGASTIAISIQWDSANNRFYVNIPSDPTYAGALNIKIYT